MDESGINLNFDLQANKFDYMSSDDISDEFLSQITSPEIQNFDFYELRSKTVPLSTSPAASPTIKTEMVKSRTQFKQILMRDQELQKEQERKKVESAKVNKPSSNPVLVPRNIQNLELPQHVLQVTTGLKHPTKYHILAKQKNQVLQYLTSSSQPDDGFYRKTGVQSEPIVQEHKIKPKLECNSVACTTLPSPEILSPTASGTSVTTSTGTSDAEDVLETILALEAEIPKDSELQSQGLYGSLLSLDPAYRSQSNNFSPSGTSQLKPKAASYGDIDPKDRLKKDNHNMIERRRRYNINDRIKELADLLPKTNDPHYDLVRDSRQNKGAILKSSVDYIKVLKKDNCRLKKVELDNKQLQSQTRKLLLRIQELERHAKENGFPIENSVWKVVSPEEIIDTIIKEDPHQKNFFHCHNIKEDGKGEVSRMEETIEDDNNILTDDTMLCSPNYQKQFNSNPSQNIDEPMSINISESNSSEMFEDNL